MTLRAFDGRMLGCTGRIPSLLSMYAKVYHFKSEVVCMNGVSSASMHMSSEKRVAMQIVAL